MDNGFHEKLADKFSGLRLDDPSSDNHSNNDNLFRVMKAVEAAEANIKQQVEENNHLRDELHEKKLELEQYKAYEFSLRPRSVDAWSKNVHGTYKAHRLNTSVENLEGGIQSMVHSSSNDQTGTVVVHKDLNQESEDTTRQTRGESPSENHKVSGTLNVVPADRFIQLSSPSDSYISPGRYQTEVEYDRQLNGSGHGLKSTAEVNNSSSSQKQDLMHTVKEHEKVIVQLRRHLTDYSVKEAQIRNEKYILENQVANMRLAFDQQEQDLIEAASKAHSYRQNIMEENIRLSYQLQAAQQEGVTFVSSLLPLLAEYSLHPPVPDAQSIVSNVKVLFKHLQEQLNITEESQFQLIPWYSKANSSAFNMQPPESVGAALASSVAAGWDVVNQHQIGLGGFLPKTMELDELGRFSSFVSRMDIFNVSTTVQCKPIYVNTDRNPVGHDDSGQFDATRADARVARQNEGTTKQVKFHEPVNNSDMDDTDTGTLHNEGESPAKWNSRISSYMAPLEDPSSSYSPNLPPVLEEHSSSVSEGTDDDPPPAVDGLQISGNAFPGWELQASVYSINGMTSCNFEWVRYMEDGSVHYIEGAKQPNYLVTADDVDTYLAIEVQPLDNRKRKGELVKVFANEHRKITCEPEMQNSIEKTLYNGHASYKVSLLTGYLDIWEPAVLAVKREGYSIKCRGSSSHIVMEKFSPNTTVALPYGHATVFSISSSGTEHILRAENSSEDVSCSRDMVVLTLRLFIIRAGQKSKVKKRGLFFNK